MILFTVEINSNSFLWPVHSVRDTSPNFLRLRRDFTDGMPLPHNAAELSGLGLMTSLG